MEKVKNKEKNYLLCLAIIFILCLNASTPAIAEQTCIAKNCPTKVTPSLNVIKEIQKPKPIEELKGTFNNKIDIVFTDIDGTMLPFDKKHPKTAIPPSVKKAVKELKKAQIPLIITTGRSLGEASEVAQGIGNANTYIITQQGTEIYDPKGKIIFQDSIDNNDVQKMLKEFELIRKLNKIDAGAIVFADGKAYGIEEVVRPYNWEKLVILKSFDELKDAKVCKLCFSVSDPKKLRILQAYMKQKFPKYQIVISADCYCDISSNIATKGSAVRKLTEMLGKDMKNVAILGDAENDITMFKEAKTNGGLAIAVGNAMQPVKENANYITSSVYENGFAKAIEEILKNNERLSN